jgi:hypothetical protein
MYIHCKTDVTIKNKVLGIYKLKKGKIYECFFVTMGRNPTLKVNNIWIAQRNLSNAITAKVNDRIKLIRKKI